MVGRRRGDRGGGSVLSLGDALGWWEPAWRPGGQEGGLGRRVSGISAGEGGAQGFIYGHRGDSGSGYSLLV